jgi:hypothetical protein
MSKRIPGWVKISILNWVVMFVFAVLMLISGVAAQTVHFAALELPNTFLQLQTFAQGIQLNGASSGSVQLISPNGANYQLVLPATSGSTGQCVCNTGTPGVLGYCAP